MQIDLTIVFDRLQEMVSDSSIQLPNLIVGILITVGSYWYQGGAGRPFVVAAFSHYPHVCPGGDTFAALSAGSGLPLHKASHERATYGIPQATMRSLPPLPIPAIIQRTVTWRPRCDAIALRFPDRLSQRWHTFLPASS